MVKAFSSNAGGTFFKPAEHSNDLAILVEPKSIRRGVQNDYNGQVTFRDEVTADLTYFKNTAQLDGSDEPEVNAGGVVVHKALTSNLDQNFGEQLVVVVTKIKNYYAWAEPSADIVAKVAAYVEKRDAGLNDAEADMFGDD